MFSDDNGFVRLDLAAETAVQASPRTVVNIVGLILNAGRLVIGNLPTVKELDRQRYWTCTADLGIDAG